MGSKAEIIDTKSSREKTLREFYYPHIDDATGGFSDGNVQVYGYEFGEGCNIAALYHGFMRTDEPTNKLPVVLKVFKSDASSSEFEQEIDLLSKLNHENIVSLVGYCRDTYRTIIYENYPESLRDRLYRTGDGSFNWEQRLKICVDAAQGLEYLHHGTDCPWGIIHRNITLDSILLDENSTAKISGLELIKPGQNVEMITATRSSRDFMAPEYLIHKRLSKKADLYSFGTVLFHVLCRNNLGSRESSEGDDSRRVHLWSLENVDTALKGQISEMSLAVFTKIMVRCLHMEPAERPDMMAVVKDLKLALEINQKDRSLPSEIKRQIDRFDDKYAPKRRGEGAVLDSDEIELEKVFASVQCPRFSLTDVREATGDFSASNLLGKGGEAKVYKGFIKNSIHKLTIKVAVKHILLKSQQFLPEVEVVSKLDHPNILSLVGYCYERDSRILVFEYMRNGSLYDHLYKGGLAHHFLSWERRLNICINVAYGLHYLHFEFNPPRGLIHRDIKPANILLDRDWTAKISDFGMFKTRDIDVETSTVISDRRGTPGYFAPEYAYDRKLSRKVDVYAFGVVLFEVLCRKKPWEREETSVVDNDESIGEWALENVDRDLRGQISGNCLKVYTDLIKKCMEPNRAARPDMNVVLIELQEALEWQKEEFAREREHFLR